MRESERVRVRVRAKVRVSIGRRYLVGLAGEYVGGEHEAHAVGARVRVSAPFSGQVNQPVDLG